MGGGRALLANQNTSSLLWPLVMSERFFNAFDYALLQSSQLKHKINWYVYFLINSLISVLNDKNLEKLTRFYVPGWDT